MDTVDRVPFIDLRRLTQTREILSAVLTDAHEIVVDAEFVGGPRVDALERVLADKLGVPQVVACANGTDALVMGLLALGVKPGDVVALPALTFWATYEAVVAVGARPLLIDCGKDLQMDPDALLWALETHPEASRVRAILPVHLFGWASKATFTVRAMGQEFGVPVLEDAAQAFGVERDGRPLLAAATMATLSFYPAKVIGGCMDGGAVTCASAEHAAVLRSLRNHGHGAQGYLHERVGINSRMSAINAAYLLRVLAMSDRILNDRRRALGRYVELLDGKRGLRVHMPPPGVVGNGYLCVVTSERRTGEELAAALEARGIGHARTYPGTVADQAPAREAMVWGDLRNAREFCRRVVNLPLFYGITDIEIERAAAALLEAS